MPLPPSAANPLIRERFELEPGILNLEQLQLQRQCYAETSFPLTYESSARFTFIALLTATSVTFRARSFSDRWAGKSTESHGSIAGIWQRPARLGHHHAVWEPVLDHRWSP